MEKVLWFGNGNLQHIGNTMIIRIYNKQDVHLVHPSEISFSLNQMKQNCLN